MLTTDQGITHGLAIDCQYALLLRCGGDLSSVINIFHPDEILGAVSVRSKDLGIFCDNF